MCNAKSWVETFFMHLHVFLNIKQFHYKLECLWNRQIINFRPMLLASEAKSIRDGFNQNVKTGKRCENVFDYVVAV